MNMDKNTFWRVIDEVNSKVPATDQDGIIQATTEKLCFEYSQQEIAVWSNYQQYYRDLADTSGLFAASCCLNDCMSDDGFNDFRMWLISQGKEVYLAALKEPDSLARLDIPADTTRFEPYGYVAYDAYDAWDMHGDVYEEKDRNPLTEAQKADVRAEIEYYPHQVTMENAESHLPNLRAKYLRPDQSILLIDYQPRFSPPPDSQIPMTELEKLKNAALLIEDMTGCRFKHCTGGAFIYPDTDVYLAINMRREADYGTRTYHISFDANLQTMGKPMDAVGMARLQQEVGVAHALLSALEIEEYTLTPEEMDAFNDFVHELDERRQEQEETSGPVMGQPSL